MKISRTPDKIQTCSIMTNFSFEFLTGPGGSLNMLAILPEKLTDVQPRKLAYPLKFAGWKTIFLLK